MSTWPICTITYIFIYFFYFRQVEAAPGYIQTVINKIVGNIRLYCNNLILKYVEDDIVLSMNIKLLTFESANNNWEPAYTGDNFNRLLFMNYILSFRYTTWRSNIKEIN